MCFGFHVRERYYNDFEKYAMGIGLKARREGIIYETTDIASGSRAAGLQPLSFPSMKRWLKLFKVVSIMD